MRTYSLFLKEKELPGYWLLILTLFFLISCSKDKGNYDYSEVNRISIGNLLDGDHNSERIYRVVYEDSLVMTPEITGTLTGSDTSQLSFVWVIDGDTLSRYKDLHLRADFGFGKKVGNFYITDHTTGTVTNYNFTLEVSSDASRGSYILCRDEAGNTVLVTKSLINPELPFRYLRELGKYELGKDPVNICLRRNSGSSATNYTYTIVLASRTSENNVIEMLANEMTPTLIYNSNSFVTPGTRLDITQYLQSLRSVNAYMVSGGKAYMAGKGMFSEILNPSDPLDYSFADDGLFATLALYGRYLVGWDSKNSRVRVFSTNGVASTNIYTVSYDNKIDPELTKGQQFLAGSEVYSGGLYKFTMTTRKDNTLSLYEVNLQSYTSVESFKKVGETTFPGLDKMARPVLSEGAGFWYFGIGRSIYRTSLLGMDLQLVATLPDDGSGGDIATMRFNFNQANNYTYLGIATYNPSSGKELKGSYYMLNLSTNQFEYAYPNSLYEPVALEIGM